jgi:uncharacterized protein
MSLDPLLLNLLACPIDKQALLYLAEDGVLYNPRLRRLYHVCDGIPVMLAEQGETVTDDQHRLLLRRADEDGGALATLEMAPRDVIAGCLAGVPSAAGSPPPPGTDQAAIAPGGRAARKDKTGSGEDAA